MKIKAFFSVLAVALFVFSSCNKENDFIEQDSLEQTKSELKDLHEDLLNAVGRLKHLQTEQLQQLAVSSNPLEELKEISPVEYEQIEKKYTAFVGKANELENSGVSTTEIKTILSEQAAQHFKVRENSNNAFNSGLPCYETWELTVSGVLIAYATCVGATGFSGVGLAGCSIGLGVGVLIAEREYEICLRASYQ